ncbi:unnamed protein product [Heligmosomoides polygyrus]|uniref:Uncharacterized protein n=1 Tax=Heligmosomoides polygyrus TaxID=6339 RepID=A0A183FKN7_HELPZ|nr:unnamed protein product [Heligmosomoides polygyrus]
MMLRFALVLALISMLAVSAQWMGTGMWGGRRRYGSYGSHGSREWSRYRGGMGGMYGMGGVNPYYGGFGKR